MAKRRKYSELNLLKGRIREKNTSYRKLSEGIGIAVNTLSDKINGFYAMSIPEAEAIALFLEISPKELDKYFFSNEYGLYSLVLGSRKPEAKAFKRWIIHEVIPSIRKTGSYSTGLTPTEALLQSVQLLALQERELNEVKHAQLNSQAALVAHEFALTTLDQKVTQEITLTTREQKQIQGAVNSRAQTIGLPELYRPIYGALKKQFGIPSYRDLRRSDLTKAFEFILCWSPGIQ